MTQIKAKSPKELALKKAGWLRDKMRKEREVPTQIKQHRATLKDAQAQYSEVNSRLKKAKDELLSLAFDPQQQKAKILEIKTLKAEKREKKKVRDIAQEPISRLDASIAMPCDTDISDHCLTVFSFGGGQDSTHLGLLALYDKEFQEKYIVGDLIFIMAETGNEHPETYEHVAKFVKLCEKEGVPFYMLDYEYTPKTWKGGLVEFYEATDKVGSKAYPKTCTDNLKIKPIYSFLDVWIADKYPVGVKSNRGVGRPAIKAFGQKYGKINVIIGIAKGEEGRRVENWDASATWQRRYVNKKYPLMDMGVDRAGAQDGIREMIKTYDLDIEVPPPSNCMFCPFMGLEELYWLFMFYPVEYKQFVKIEQAKFNKYEAKGYPLQQNLGVWGEVNKLLPEKLEEAKEQVDSHLGEELNRDPSKQEIKDYLQEYKMSHGHCMTTKY